jgi:hypothetical protein
MAMLNEAFNPNVLESRATPKQDEVLRDVWARHKYVIAGNQSGKSSLKARDIAWKFTETHPYWQRPNSKRCMNKLCGSTEFDTRCENGDMANAVFSCKKCPTKWMDWRDDKLNMIIGSKTAQLTQELWDEKLEPYLYGVKMKIERQGHSIKKVINIDPDSPGFGNKILFFSHDNAKQAAARVQSLTLHDVWLDELPDDWKLVEELHRRTDAKRAQFCATFTPKTPNPEVRRIIDEGDLEIVSKYKFGMLDNPAYANRKEEQLKALNGMSEAQRNCVLYGDWLDGDEKVFLFSKENNVIESIQGYDPSWPHVVAVDPAMSITGWVLACWNPIEGKWFIVRAEYLKADKEKDSPKTIINKLEAKLTKYNVVRRIYDPHETWWMTTAREECGAKYIPVPSKTTRKKELLVNLIKAIGERKLMFVGELGPCYDELHRADWHPEKDHVIKGATHYHIIDSLQYLWDLLPTDVKTLKKSLTYDQELVRMWQEEKKIKAEVKQAKGYDKYRKKRKLTAFRKRPKIW